MKNVSTHKLIQFKLASIAIGLFFMISCSEQKTDAPKPDAFDIKNYKFKNQDPMSIAARNAIDKGARKKNQRTINMPGGTYVNLGFNPHGYQYINGSTVYRPSAYIQNYYSSAVQVEIEAQAEAFSTISNISLSGGGSYSQTSNNTYTITIPAYTTVYSNFDMNFRPTVVEGYARIYMISPSYVSPDYSNDWVYPIR